MEIIQGALTKIFRQFESGYIIATIDPGGQKVVGTLPNPVIGDRMEFHGEWKEHKKYGRQFCFDMAVTVVPKTNQDMLEFLSLLKNIGPVRAQAIMDTFGDSIFDILDHAPQRLTIISGITPERANTIAECWKRLKADKDTIFFLNSLGCTPQQRALIMSYYQEKTIELLKANPYRIIKDIKGFGFKTVDGLALKMGIEVNSPLRADAGVEYILKSAAESKQHTYLPENVLIKEGVSELGISRRRLKDALISLAENNLLVHNVKEEWCALKSFHDSERNIADRIKALLDFEVETDFEKLLSEAFEEASSSPSIVLNDRQMEAVRIACGNNLAIITGLPGTGKTTLLKTVLNIYKDKRIRLASPTGKAAKRMEEATGLSACTVHRLLEYNPEKEGFTRCASLPVDADLVVIDESSMMDVNLMDSLLKAIAPGTKLIFVGDADQLPSVGPGNVLADLLSSKKIPSIKLTQIMRQAEASTIIKNAHRINRGLPIDIYGKQDFFFIEEDDPDLLVRKIRKLVTEDIPRKFGLDPANEIQVLCPQNVGPIGSIVLNNGLQRSLNPARDNKPEVKVGGEDYAYFLRMGDRVIQTVNNYTLGVFNGTTGVIVEVDPDSRMVWVDFSNGPNLVDPSCPEAGERRPGRAPARNTETLEYKSEYLKQLKLAYAISVHKSQGSEFPCVVIPIHFLNKHMLVKNLLYTGITRGKKYVVIVGTEEAVDYAIENDRPTQRYTLLRRFLEASGNR